MGARVVTLPKRAESAATETSRLQELEAEAERLWEEGDLDRAIQHWSDIVRHDPGRSAARRRLAKALMVAERWEEASRQLNLCLTLSPGSAGITAELGVCYLHLDQASNALLLLRESLRLQPGMRLAEAALDSFVEEVSAPDEAVVERGLLLFQPATATAIPTVDWKKWIDRALESENEVEAAESLSDILLIAPDCTRALYELARLHDLTGRTGWATRYYERAIRGDPQAWQPYFNLARLHTMDGRYAPARTLLERATLLCPGEFAPCWLLAQVCEQLNDLEEARFWLGRAKTLDAANADVEVALARLCSGDAASEMEHLENAVRLGCDRPEVLFNFGLHLLRADQADAALTVWRRTDMAEATHASAALAFEAGDYDECARLLEAKTHGGLLALLGKAFAERGDTDRALECYRAAVGEDSDSAEAWVNLGALLASQGLASTEEWQTALRLNPSLAASYFS